MTSDNRQEDVTIMLDVSRDELEVFLTLIPLTQSPEFSSDKIKKALSEKGIKSGIKDDVLESFEKKITYNERILIAEGTKPIEGKNGTIQHLFEDSAKVKVGDTIGKIIPPEQGTEGLSVLGRNIPVRKVKEAEIPELVNVELNEDEKILAAKVDGYLSINRITVRVIPFFEVKVSDDGFQAHATVEKPRLADDINGEDLKKYLNENGIVYGILVQEIENIFSQGIYNQPVLVAQGKEVVDDKDGAIQYLFESMTKPFMDDRGNIDYKELNLIQNVQAGERLAEIIPPVPGETGYTVLGKEITPKKGVQPTLPSGKNTKPDPSDPNVLIAEIEGCVKLRGKNVDVDSLFVVKENVDYSTGNISFKGSVVINGDVKSGFKVKVKNDVQINGILEDAIVEAGGNVLLKNGFIGRNKGHIIAHGNVTAKFCENESIIADGDIHISDYVMNSRILTKGHLLVKDKTGLVLGGESCALKGIEANVVGNKNYTHTRLCVGVDKVTESYLENNIKYLEEIEKILNKLARRKLVKKDLPENMREMIDRLHRIVSFKEEENKRLKEEYEAIERNAEELKKGVVKIHSLVYPGTWITIYNNHMEVIDPRKSVWYSYAENDIVALDL